MDQSIVEDMNRSVIDPICGDTRSTRADQEHRRPNFPSGQREGLGREPRVHYGILWMKKNNGYDDMNTLEANPNKELGYIV